MNNGVFTLLEMVTHLKAVERDLDDLGPAVVARACQMVAREAKRLIGRQNSEWEPLKPETIAERVRAGFAANKPLLRTGELRDSIEWSADGLQGAVGSNLDIAVYQELGTSRMPPRSFLALAALHKEQAIYNMAARAAVAVIAGRGLHSQQMRHLVHLLRHVFHHVKETAEHLLEDDDEK